MFILLLSATEKGVCMPTVVLWAVFIYIEAWVRLKEVKNVPFHMDLCRPFAAHWSVVEGRSVHTRQW